MVGLRKRDLCKERGWKKVLRCRAICNSRRGWGDKRYSPHFTANLLSAIGSPAITCRGFCFTSHPRPLSQEGAEGPMRVHRVCCAS